MPKIPKKTLKKTPNTSIIKLYLNLFLYYPMGRYSHRQSLRRLRREVVNSRHMEVNFQEPRPDPSWPRKLDMRAPMGSHHPQQFCYRRHRRHRPRYWPSSPSSNLIFHLCRAASHPPPHLCRCTSPASPVLLLSSVLLLSYMLME